MSILKQKIMLLNVGFKPDTRVCMFQLWHMNLRALLW